MLFTYPPGKGVSQHTYLKREHWYLTTFLFTCLCVGSSFCIFLVCFFFVCFWKIHTWGLEWQHSYVLPQCPSLFFRFIFPLSYHAFALLLKYFCSMILVEASAGAAKCVPIATSSYTKCVKTQLSHFCKGAGNIFRSWIWVWFYKVCSTIVTQRLHLPKYSLHPLAFRLIWIWLGRTMLTAGGTLPWTDVLT